MSTENEPQDDTLATEVFDREPVAASGASQDTAALPTIDGGPTPSRAPDARLGPDPTVPTDPPERTYLRGPAPFAIVLGLLGLLVAGAVVLGELTDLTVHWINLGPWTVVAAGVVVLVVGALGVRASRPRG